MFDRFQKYLMNRVHVKDKHIPFYLKWISDCYTYLNESVQNRITTEQKQQFLKHISINNEDWQVK